MKGALFLGVEGGATRSTGVLADGRMQVVARQEAGPTNVHAVGEVAARTAVVDIVDALLTAGGVGWDGVGASAFCMAGLRGEADRAFWRGLVEDIGVRGPVLLTHDAAAGMAAGSPDETGILVVCGTGSFVYGRSAAGREHFVGGRGPILGDEGSGFDIAWRGLRAAARSADGRGPKTVLERVLPERLGLGGLDEIVAWVHPFSKGRTAGLAPAVFEAAAGGDQVAEGIVQSAAEELARCVAIVAGELWPPGDWVDTVERVVLSGGVLRHQPPFRERLALLIRKRLLDVRCVEPEVDGAVGAARVARRWLRSQAARP